MTKKAYKTLSKNAQKRDNYLKQLYVLNMRLPDSLLSTKKHEKCERVLNKQIPLSLESVCSFDTIYRNIKKILLTGCCVNIKIR